MDQSEVSGDEDINMRMDAADHGSVVVGTSTNNLDYPTTPGAFQPQPNGPPGDAVLSRLSLLPRGVGKFGVSSPGCAGELALGVTAMPQVGSTDFGVTCIGAPPQSRHGVLVVSTGALNAPVNHDGAQMWIDPSGVVSLRPLESDSVGYSELPLRVPHTPGDTTYVQAFWPDPCAPGGLSASNALALTILD